VRHMQYLRVDQNAPYQQLIGVGGVGTGIFFELEGNHTLGRNESRLGRLLDVRDYCKLHIVIHYIAKLLGTRLSESAFRITPIAMVGDDGVGQRVIREMKEVGIDTARIQIVPGAPSLFSVCFQYPDGTGGNLTTSNSAAGLLSSRDIDEIADLLSAGTRRTIALAVPEVPLEVRRHFLQLATRTGSVCVASFAAMEVGPAWDLGMFDLLDLVSLNENEGEELVDCTFSAESPELFVRKCQELLRASHPQLKVIITAGELGAYGITVKEYNFCPAAPVKVASTAGAGDALLGGVIAGLATGLPFLSARSAGHGMGRIESALQLGVLLGSYKCLSPHTIHPHAGLDTLLEFAESQGLSCSPELGNLLVRDMVAQSPISDIPSGAW